MDTSDNNNRYCSLRYASRPSRITVFGATSVVSMVCSNHGRSVWPSGGAVMRSRSDDSCNGHMDNVAHKALTKVEVASQFENAVLLNKYLGRMSVPMEPGTEFDEVLNTVPAYSLAISVEGRCFSGVGAPTVSAAGDAWEFNYPFTLLESYAEQVTTQHMPVSQPA